MKLEEQYTKTTCLAKVISSQRISARESADEVREIEIEVEGPNFDPQVGQNIGVLVPGQIDIGQDVHFRLYSIADVPQTTPEGRVRICICVRRCSYIDEFSGEEYPGLASNYLCDLQPGATLTITGPYGQAFEVPGEQDATLILICAGTGIAPFRAFVKHLYTNCPEFNGRVWLLHGGKTGIDLLYRNDEKDDFALYYDRETFEVINALSKRPGWSDKTDWGTALQDRSEELCDLLTDPKTYVYLAGLEAIRDELDQVMADVAGSEKIWFQWKAELEAEGRWIELLY